MIELLLLCLVFVCYFLYDAWRAGVGNTALLLILLTFSLTALFTWTLKEVL